MTKDEITAPHVNLVPLDLPGDLYKYVAAHVWPRIEQDKHQLTREKQIECELFIDELVAIKTKIADAAQKPELRQILVGQYQEFKKKKEELLGLAAPVFWSRMTDGKQQRKVVKRNVMTLPFKLGGSKRG